MSDPTVVTFGGGTNSTALLIGMIERGDPAPLAITFGDTGGELPHTYEHIERFSAWLVAHGYPAISRLFRARRDKSWKSLEQECVDKAMLPSIAYGYKTCSQKFKVEPQNKFLNNFPACKAVWKAGGRIKRVIGYDAGEVRRARFGGDKKFVFSYPLIEWGWDRDACIAAIARHPEVSMPGKSSCFFCPHMRKPELLALRDQYPELLDRALAMEAGANLTKIKGLGRRFAWRDFFAGLPVADRAAGDLDQPCDCFEAGSGSDAWSFFKEGVFA